LLVSSAVIVNMTWLTQVNANDSSPMIFS